MKLLSFQLPDGSAACGKIQGDGVADLTMRLGVASLRALLGAGDVIVTGTPGGVGAKRSPPLWMKAGDVAEVEISGIGTLRNRVEDEA